MATATRAGSPPARWIKSSASWVRAARVRGGRVAEQRDLGLSVPGLTSFGVDPAGELYAMSLSGPVYRLAPA